jgi:hypothetical protein
MSHVDLSDTNIKSYTLLNDKLHSYNDNPAIIYKDGDKCWYHEGKLHRDFDSPAYTSPDGHCEWYYKGKLHRNNGKPAVTDKFYKCYVVDDYRHHEIKPSTYSHDGYTVNFWFQNGRLFRPNNKPVIEEIYSMFWNNPEIIIR